MATEDSDATPPSLCDFCHHDTVVWQTERLRFGQRTNRGMVRCEVSLPIGRCDTCGSVHLGDGAETLIEVGLRAEATPAPKVSARKKDRAVKR